MNCYAFIREARETCRALDDVENLLLKTDRMEGMNLFAVEGKSRDFCVFECSTSEHLKTVPGSDKVLSTNHSCLRLWPQSFGLLHKPAQTDGRTFWNVAPTFPAR